MKTTRFLSILLLLLCTSLGNAQERGMKLSQQEMQAEKRVALVIGNGAYKDSPLRNPVNDARAMVATLKSFGFKVLTGENLNQKEMKYIIREFGQQIKSSGVGLFYYAGHGVQSNGRNYLLPTGAEINKEPDIELEAVDAGYALAEMEGAQNRINIVILDACRNNPFGRSYRSANRGLAQMTAPTGTFIAYSTAPGSIAADGDGSNGLYTQELIRVIRTPGTKLEDVFKTVLSGVKQASGGKQVPWTSSSVEGDFYFNTSGVVVDTKAETTRAPAEKKKVKEEPKETIDPWLKDLEAKAKERELAKAAMDDKIRPMSEDFAKIEEIEKKPIDNKDKAEAWSRFLERYKNDIPDDTRDDDMRAKATIRMNDLVPKAIFVSNTIGMEFVLVQPGTFMMGSFEGEANEMPVHAVTISKPYYIGKYEVTQKQWRDVMGSNPSQFQGDNRPVETVSWKDAQEFIRKLNEKEGSTKYRLPTEAEWEFAARGGTQNQGFKFSGANDIATVAVYDGNSRNETKRVGSKRPNELGIYDMSGNIREWCEDWYGQYSGNDQRDPKGATSGSERVLRGGSFGNYYDNCRVTLRDHFNPIEGGGHTVGFRCVRD